MMKSNGSAKDVLVNLVPRGRNPFGQRQGSLTLPFRTLDEGNKGPGTRQLSGSSDFLTRSDTLAPLAPDYTISDFQSGTKFVFSLHE